MPDQQNAAESLAGSQRAKAPADTRPRVLLVDDQPARLLTYEALLEGVGVQCVRALSGREALDRLLHQTFALILLDVSMPEMDGFETARLIREHPRFEHTPIIFVTGVHISALDTLKGYEVGAIDYISVPIVPEILRSKVALLVELYRRRTQLEQLSHPLQQQSDREEKEWLAAVLNSMNEEVYFTDVNKRYTYANPAALREFGHNSVQGVDVASIVSGLEVLRPDGTARPLDEAPPLRALTGEVVRDEEQIVRIPRTGELRHRQVSSAPVRDAAGHIIGSVSVVRDVTAQKRVEAELRVREICSSALVRLGDDFRSLTEPSDLAYAAARLLGETLNVSRCGYGTIDPVAETISIERDWNAPGVTTIAGVLKFREYGTYIDDLKRGDTVVCSDVDLDPRTRDTADRLKALNARSFINMPITEAEGTVALLYLNDAQPRLWSQGDLAFIRDVAQRTRTAVERRRNEHALAQELKHTRLLRDIAARVVLEGNLPALFDEILAAAMTITDAPGGTVQLLNPQTRSLSFIARRGLEPELTSQFETVTADSGSPCGLALARGSRIIVDFDADDVMDCDGSMRAHLDFGWRCAQSTPLLSRAGQPLGMFSTYWREHRRLTDTQLRFLDLLARQAADLIERSRAEQDLREREQQLREADRRKDEFIAMLAHELRNPLVPIRTGVELLKSAAEQPQITRAVQPMMERQVGHMVRLIDDLLDVSRITSGKIELKREPTTLTAVVSGAIDANRSAINTAALDLTVNLSEPHRVLNVDPTRLAQVVSNLLQNAAKFTPTGGKISLTSTIEPGNPPHLVLTVADNGIGIDAALLPRIFDLFVQSEVQGSHRSGLGIGLALARRIAEMHGGTIEAHSKGRGHGSEFTVRIPAPNDSALSAQPEAHEAGALRGITVLVIDDNEDAAQAMALLLTGSGATVQVANNGRAGVALARSLRPAVVLLDIGMPGMDGYETCRLLRHDHHADIEIVALTGWGQERDRQSAFTAGFDAHLTKPADPARVINVVRQARRRT